MPTMPENRRRNPPGTVTECKSCSALIVWTRTEHGKKMPCDMSPSADGQFYLNGAPTDRIRVQVGYDPGHIGEGEGFLVTDIELEGPMVAAPEARNLYLGWDGNPGHGMNGWIRDVFVYDRALSAEEMKALSGV